MKENERKKNEKPESEKKGKKKKNRTPQNWQKTKNKKANGKWIRPNHVIIMSSCVFAFVRLFVFVRQSVWFVQFSEACDLLVNY